MVSFDHLSYRERRILEMRAAYKAFPEIAENFGITEARVHQIEMQALARLLGCRPSLPSTSSTDTEETSQAPRCGK